MTKANPIMGRGGPKPPVLSCTCHIDCNGPVGCYHDFLEDDGSICDDVETIMYLDDHPYFRAQLEYDQEHSVKQWLEKLAEIAHDDLYEPEERWDGDERDYYRVPKWDEPEPVREIEFEKQIREAKAVGWDRCYRELSQDVVAWHPQSTGGSNPYR